jgi:predicted outer membrane lipoprotein
MRKQSGLPQAAARGTLNALAVEAFNDLLKKHGKRTQLASLPFPRNKTTWGRLWPSYCDAVFLAPQLVSRCAKFEHWQ